MMQNLIRHEVKSLSADLKWVLTDIRENNLKSARERIGKMQKTLGTVRSAVSRGAVLFGSAPQMQAKVNKARRLLDAADLALKEILLPAVELLEAYPVSRLKVGEGLDARLAERYLDFAAGAVPKLEQVVKAAESVNLKKLDPDGELTGYLAWAKQLIGFCRREKMAMERLKTMIGTEEQTPVEIHGTGKHSGSVFTVKIQNGVLILKESKPAVC